MKGQILGLRLRRMVFPMKPHNSFPNAFLPCRTCPGRVNQNATTIPRYDHTKACGLLQIVGEGDVFRECEGCNRRWCSPRSRRRSWTGSA